MALTKKVNGQTVTISPTEETEIRNQWDENRTGTKARELLKQEVETIAEKENHKKLKRFKVPIQLAKAITILNKKIDGISLTAGEQNTLDQLTNTITPDLDAINDNVDKLKSDIDNATNPYDVDLKSGWPT